MTRSPAAPGSGISRALARERAARISGVRYDVALSVPDERDSPIRARVSIGFTLTDVAAPVPLDFEPRHGGGSLGADVNGQRLDLDHVNGHVVLPMPALRTGANVVTMSFEVDDAPLNRTAGFLYSLFVPARAHEALPCFDQPDLKARWRLSMNVPGGWEALANGGETSRQTFDGRTHFIFQETPPLSSYLFAFAAGRLSVESAARRGRTFRVLHREAVEEVAGSLDAIVDLHASSIAWLEEYTGIPYPFGKFDVLLVPAFQFSGMEHPGAIYYNAASVLLDASATEAQRIDQAALIAHETAHIWFGDLVTMPWFDDVWVKEVFANLMAGKILAASLPDLNHDVRFLHAHYPPAYDVDRTDGSNPIRQPLANLNEAGSLYGAIVYHKAPIVMQQLEMRLGPAAFRDGVREYLRRHAFGNASWQNLVDIFDGVARGDAGDWSRPWVDETGRPIIETSVSTEDGRIARLALVDTTRNRHAWDQSLRVALVYDDRVQSIPALLDREVVEIEAARGLPAPAAILPNGAGVGYADFRLDRDSLDWLMQELAAIDDALVRGAAWLTLWDAMLNGDVAPGRLIDLAIRALPRERDEQTIQRGLAYLQHAYWRFTAARRRLAIAPRVERMLIDAVHLSPVTTLKSSCFATLRGVAVSATTLDWLTAVWHKTQAVPGMPLAERDDIALVRELAVRAVPGWERMVAAQCARTASADRRERLSFMAPALSDDPLTRDRFFASLRERENRRHEPWVLEAVQYLHHPLRAERSTAYIRPSLDLLRDIQRTGDIFFPKRWVDATLSGHQSAAAAGAVQSFLDDLPSDYPDRLRRAVVSSADPLFRAVRIVTPDGS